MTVMTSRTRAQQIRRASRRGMTLIEIVVVITILALLATAVSVAAIHQLDVARVDTAKLDLHNIGDGLGLYRAQKGRYPDPAHGLDQLLEAGTLKELPVDPWGTKYAYSLTGDEPRVVSYGKDGAPGGEGFDADLVYPVTLARR